MARNALTEAMDNYVQRLKTQAGGLASNISSGVKTAANYFNPNAGVVQQPRFASPIQQTQVPQVRSFWTDIPQVPQSFKPPPMLGDVTANLIPKRTGVAKFPGVEAAYDIAGNIARETLNAPQNLVYAGVKLNNPFLNQQERIQTMGQFGNAALNLLPFTKAGRLLEVAPYLKNAGVVKSALAGAAGTGLYGGAQSVLKGLSEGNNNVVENFKAGFGPGAIIGGVAGGVGAKLANHYIVNEKDVTPGIAAFRPNWTPERVAEVAKRFVQRENGKFNGSLKKVPSFASDEALGLSAAEAKALRIKLGLDIAPPGMTVQKLSKEEGDALRKLSFSGPYKRGDITTLENELDKVLGTKEFINSNKWEARYAARETAKKQLEYYAQQGDQGAINYLNTVKGLEDELVKARGAKNQPIPQATKGVGGGGIIPGFPEHLDTKNVIPIKSNGKIVGGIDAVKDRFDPQRLVVNRIMIAPEEQGKGIGTNAVNQLFKDNPDANQIIGHYTTESKSFWQKVGGVIDEKSNTFSITRPSTPPPLNQGVKIAEKQNIQTPKVKPQVAETKAPVPQENITSQQPGVPSGEIINPTDPFYNVNRLNIKPEAKTALKEKIIGEVKPEFEKIMGNKMSSDEIIRNSQVASDEIIKVIGREQTVELGAAQLRLRQSISEMADNGAVTKDMLEKLRADKAFSANTARLLQQRAINADPKSPNGRLLQSMLKNILDVNDDIDAVMAKAKNVDFTNPQQATKFYREFIKPSAGEWADKLRYNSMLTSPNTHINNASSNWQGTGLITPIQKTIEGGIDAVLSALNPSRPRTRFAGEGLQYAKGYYNPQTVKAAFKNMWDVVSGKTLIEHPDARGIPLSTGGVPRAIENTLDIAGKALESVDQLFKTLTEGGLKKAYEYRLNKGVKLAPDAAEEAQNLLFRGKLTQPGSGAFSNAIGAGGEWVKKATQSQNSAFRWMAKLTLPFVNIGTNLAKAGFEFTPGTGAVNMIGNSDKISQAAKMIIGSTVIASAVPFALSDRLTFKLPTGPRGEAAKKAGMLDYAIKVPTPIGEKWVQYNKMHPAIAWNLGLVASLTDAVKNKTLAEDAASSIMEGAWSWLQFGLDQTYFKNVSDFMSGIQGNVERFSYIPTNYVSQFIPFRAFGSWINRIIDIYERKPDTSKSVVVQSLQQLASQIPVLSQLAPIRTDSQGQPITRKDRFINALSPARVSSENTSAIPEYQKAVNESLKIRTETDLREKVRVSGGVRRNGSKIFYSVKDGNKTEVKSIDLTQPLPGFETKYGVESMGSKVLKDSQFFNPNSSITKDEAVKILKDLKADPRISYSLAQKSIVEDQKKDMRTALKIRQGLNSIPREKWDAYFKDLKDQGYLTPEVIKYIK